MEVRGDGGPLLTVTLDAYASAIVRRILREHPADTTEADMVNATLACNWGEKDDHDSDEELAAARERRHAAQQKKGGA